MTPRSAGSRALRDVVLDLAAEVPFARPLVNSGRLSTAVPLPGSPLSTPDTDHWAGGVPPGSAALDGWTGDEWLLGRLGGRFVLLGDGLPADGHGLAIATVDVAGCPEPETIRERYALTPGAAYLVRPDSHVAARWRMPSPAAARAALARASGW
jgi:3-(3-hydroxy-phenyl)propionate hydroxylase